MTCIVGLVKDKRVYLGSDSAGGNNVTYAIRQEAKVFKRNTGGDEMLFGCTGSFRFGQLLQYSLNTPKHPQKMNNHKYMVTLFVDAVRQTLSSGGYAEKKDEAERGGTALIGYRGQLWKMEEDYQIALSPQIGDSVGVGCAVARGALHAIKDLPLSPKVKIQRALNAAEAIIVNVRGPFKIITGAKGGHL